MKRTLAILAPFLIATWCPQAFPQKYPGTAPTNVYKCSESGKAVYTADLCASGPSKPLKTHDAKGIEAPKESARPSQDVQPGPAPVAVIPHTPSKPLSNSQLPRTPAPCRTAGYGSC
jgi:hypothetical protein